MSDSPYAFDGEVIRLTAKDFGRWSEAYRTIDLVASLQSRDDWLRSLHEDDDRRKRWFVSTSMWLMRQNQEARERARPSGFDPDSF